MPPILCAGEEAVRRRARLSTRSFFANLRVMKSLTFSGFVDYQPEDHKREGDDATATLISFSLTATF